MYARLNDGNYALALLEKQLKYTEPTFVKTWKGGGTYPNMFCAHPPFQIDGNFGFVSGVLEMLVDVRGDKLCLLPALPDKWKRGSLKGVRIKGGKVLDIAWEDGKLVYVKERGTENECK
jgi:alpha-L-fucosidase 2